MDKNLLPQNLLYLIKAQTTNHPCLPEDKVQHLKSLLKLSNKLKLSFLQDYPKSSQHKSKF